MMPVMYRCGVTSNAGFRICAPIGRQPRRAQMRDLALIALLDRNVLAVRRRQIDRRDRRRDVERHLVLVREHGHGVGADLVRGVAVGRDAVGADDDESISPARISGPPCSR
jgi:hypothetical protein